MYHYITKTKPYQHQIDAVQKLYGKAGIALFHEMGTGKTKTIIDIACNYYLEKKINAVMIIAPNGVHNQWIDEELPKHSSVPYHANAWNSKQTKGELIKRKKFFADTNGLKWFCVNVEAFSTQNHLQIFVNYLKTFNCFLVLDEATRIKNPQANRTTNILYNLAQVIKSGRKVVDIKPYSKYRAILTGTMITNSPYDLWAMFEFLQHNYFDTNYFGFKARYGIEIADSNPHTGQRYTRKVRPDEISSVHKYHGAGKTVETIAAILSISESSVQYLIDHPNILAPYKRLDELKQLIEPLSHIVRIEDCIDLPPKVYEKLYVQMTADQKRVYCELRDQYITTLDDKSLSVQNKIALVGRLQQITGGFFPYDEEGKYRIVSISSKNPKIEAIKEDLNEAGESPIIIWARFVGELKMLFQELPKAFPEKVIELYYGGIETVKRKKIIEAFKEGQVNILIANPKTAGIGLNLQKSHLQYFYSNDYSLEARLQAEARSHRSGQEHSVVYKDIICRGTVDEPVLNVLQAKKSLLDYFRDNSLTDFIG